MPDLGRTSTISDWDRHLPLHIMRWLYIKAVTAPEVGTERDESALNSCSPTRAAGAADKQGADGCGEATKAVFSLRG